MKANTSIQLLLLAVVATPAIAIWSKSGQDPVDWSVHVRKACESRRFGIRLAAAKRVAKAGDDAIPAIASYAKDKGQNAIPASLVDAIADAPKHTPKVTALLTTWAEDQSFFWRSNAMRGLALRAQGADNNIDRDRWAGLFHRYSNDDAWLMRTHARFGAELIGRTDAKLETETDPRARVRLTRLLLDAGRTPSLQPLVDALADERTFLGIPWGARLGQEAGKAFSRWLGEDFPELTPGNALASAAAIVAVAEKKSGQDLTLPKLQQDAELGVTGGFEIASCKYGDQFVQWTPDGTVYFGIDGNRKAKLPAEQWQQLLQQQTAIALEKNAGVVVCDKLQLVLTDPKTRVDIAPQSLPAQASDWLKQLASKLEEAKEASIAAELRRGLGQFEGQ